MNTSMHLLPSFVFQGYAFTLGNGHWKPRLRRKWEIFQYNLDWSFPLFFNKVHGPGCRKCRRCTLPLQHSRVGLGASGAGEPALKTWAWEIWLCPSVTCSGLAQGEMPSYALLLTTFGKLENWPWGHESRRAALLRAGPAPFLGTIELALVSWRQESQFWGHESERVGPGTYRQQYWVS